MHFDEQIVIGFLLVKISLFRRSTVLQGATETQREPVEPPIEGTPSNFVMKLGRERVNALGYILVKIA